MSAYIPVLVMGVFAVVIACVVVLAPGLLGPRRKGALKDAPYECGLPQGEGLGRRLPVRFYAVAVLFMLFDVELAFLYPWVAWFQRTTPGEAVRVYAFGAMLAFVAALAIGFVYEWRRGGLEWE